MRSILATMGLAMALAAGQFAQQGAAAQGSQPQGSGSAINDGSVHDQRNPPAAGEENRTPASDRGRDSLGNDPDVLKKGGSPGDAEASPTGTAGEDGTGADREVTLGSMGILLFVVALALAALFAGGMVRRRRRVRL